MLSFGIIGCGAIGRWHAQSLMELENARLVGCTDPVPTSAERFALDYGIETFDTPDQMLASDRIDAVCICTPSGFHAPLAVAAANAGKHVVVEKPMALSISDCDRIEEAVARSGIRMAVISQNRLAAPVVYVKKALEEERFGKIVCADVIMKYWRSPEYYASGSWRGTWKLDGGGALMNQGIHGVDILQYLCGPVRSVFCHASTLCHSIEVEDTLSAVLTFRSGALGVMQATTSVQPGFPRRIEINGTKGSVTLRDTEIENWSVVGEPVPEDIPRSHVKGDTSSNPMALTTDGHKFQLSDFIEAVEQNRKPFVDHRDGRIPVEIILAAYESARTGREVLL